MRPVQSLASTAALLALANPIARASLSQSNCPLPGGFVQAAAQQPTCSINPGQDLGNCGGLFDFHEQAFSAGASAVTAAVFSSETIVLTTSGSSGMGYLRATGYNLHPDSANFPT